MKKRFILYVLIIAWVSLFGFGFYLVKGISAQNIKLNDHIKLLEKNVVSLNETLAQYQRSGHAREKSDAEALDYLRWRFVLKDQVDAANKRLKARTVEINTMKKDKSEANLTYYSLGLSCVLASDFEGAIGAFEEALKYDPKDAQSCYNLGLLYSTYRSDPKNAVKYYEKYIALIPKGDKSEEVKERIDLLKNNRKT